MSENGNENENENESGSGSGNVCDGAPATMGSQFGHWCVV